MPAPRPRHPNPKMADSPRHARATVLFGAGGYGAGVARAVGHFFGLGWRGSGAGILWGSPKDPPPTPGQATRWQRWSGRRGSGGAAGAAVSKGEWRAPQAPPSAKVNGGCRRLHDGPPRKLGKCGYDTRATPLLLHLTLS
eukprot:gene23624-biopygen20835